MNHGEEMNLSTRRGAIEIVKEGEHKVRDGGVGRRRGKVIVFLYVLSASTCCEYTRAAVIGDTVPRNLKVTTFEPQKIKKLMQPQHLRERSAAQRLNKLAAAD